MPLFEYRCSNCTRITERYFRRFAESERAQRCACGGHMEKLLSAFCFQRFRPFVTRNIHPEGKPIHITSRSHLERLCRDYRVVPSPLNDTAEGRADPREFLSLKRKRPQPPKIQKATVDEFEPIARRAVDTRFGTVGI